MMKWGSSARDSLASKRFLAGCDMCLATDAVWAELGALQMFTRQERKHWPTKMIPSLNSYFGGRNHIYKYRFLLNRHFSHRSKTEKLLVFLGRESFKNLCHDRPPPSCCPSHFPLDSDLASDGFICVKLSRGQLLDATQLLNSTYRLPRMLCGGVINGLTRLIENEQAAASRRTQRTPVDPYRELHKT